MISFVSASKNSFDFLSSYRLLFWYLLFRYRWAHHLCFLSMNDLSRSSFFDLSIYVSIYLHVFVTFLEARLFEAYAVPPLQAQGWKTSCVPTKSWKLCDWLIVSEIFVFVMCLYFLSATKMCHSLNELVNRAMVGRSRWTTIVRGSLFFFQQFTAVCSILSNWQ